MTKVSTNSEAYVQGRRDARDGLEFCPVRYTTDKQFMDFYELGFESVCEESRMEDAIAAYCKDREHQFDNDFWAARALLDEGFVSRNFEEANHPGFSHLQDALDKVLYG